MFEYTDRTVMWMKTVYYAGGGGGGLVANQKFRLKNSCCNLRNIHEFQIKIQRSSNKIEIFNAMLDFN